MNKILHPNSTRDNSKFDCSKSQYSLSLVKYYQPDRLPTGELLNLAAKITPTNTFSIINKGTFFSLLFKKNAYERNMLLRKIDTTGNHKTDNDINICCDKSILIVEMSMN